MAASLPSPGTRLSSGPAMNFLGHLHLSGPDPLVIVGNFMGDAVKGRDLSRFVPLVREGIMMHRAIDSFTDQHPLVRQGRARVRAHAGRYSGVALDLFYDHVLAADWEHWSDTPLPEFARRMYRLLQEHHELLPARTRGMLPYMVQGDWLTSYGRMEGLARALRGLASRVPEGSPMVGAEAVLERHFEAYRSEFRAFLPELAAHLKERAWAEGR